MQYSGKKVPARHIHYFIILIFPIICFSLAAGCASTDSALPPEENLPAHIPAEHLIFIGLDGWGGAYVQKADMPTVKRMMAGGASSLYVKCVKPSNSLPNWTALFSGAPPEDQTTGLFPTIFSLVKNSGSAGNPALFYEWSGLQNIIHADTAERKTIFSDRESAELIAAYIVKEKPAFTAAVFNEPDSAGHSNRWGSAAYCAKLAELDSFIAVIEQAAKDAGIYDSTVFMLSADHGGVLWGHGFNGSKQCRIPLVIYGSNIKEGYAIPKNRSICDIAPTMAVILGLQVPPEWAGQPLQGIFK